MADLPRVGDMEIAEDPGFQKREWTAMRIGWVFMGLLVLAALAGLFGPGPLSKATAGTEGGPLWVEYDRFERYGTPGALHVHIGPSSVTNGEARVHLDRKYLEGMQIETMSPEPERTEVSPDGATYVFRVSDASRPAEVLFHIRPGQSGRIPGTVRLAEGPSVQFNQMVYP